jgi:hypothetical protein
MAGKNLSHKPFEIPEDNPFANCKLDREPYADVLTNIVENYSDGFVLAIKNGWGQGKTTFIKMWQQKLNNLEFNTLYFNAWENDFQDDVILALIAELEELRPKSKKQFDNLLDKTAKFMKKVAPAAIKGAAGKLIGDDTIATVIEAGTEFITEEVETSLKEIKERKKGIIEFRTSLEDFATSVDNEKPIVFFIDELDRCRPNYSVKILEKIKHFFNVPGIVFVLSIDKMQLCHAIKGAYGSESFNAKEYLKRFIDLEYSIPEPDLDKVIHYYFEYFGITAFYKIERRLKEDLQGEYPNLLESFRVVSASKNLNLRDVEKILAHFRIFISTFQENQFTFPEIALLIILLKKYNEELIKSIIYKFYTPQELVNKLEKEFKIHHGDEERQKRVLSFMFATFSYAYCYYLKGNYYPRELVEYKEGKNHLNLSTNYDQGKFEGVFMHRMKDRSINDVDFEWISKRIDFTEKIVS